MVKIPDLVIAAVAQRHGATGLAQIGSQIRAAVRRHARHRVQLNALRHRARNVADLHTNAYNGKVPLVQVRDVPESTVAALKAQAAERGLTLAALLRAELERIARRPTNAEVVARMARRRRAGGPTTEQTVNEVRGVRTAS
jgi:hypothetical protein